MMWGGSLGTMRGPGMAFWCQLGVDCFIVFPLNTTSLGSLTICLINRFLSESSRAPFRL